MPIGTRVIDGPVHAEPAESATDIGAAKAGPGPFRGLAPIRREWKVYVLSARIFLERPLGAQYSQRSEKAKGKENANLPAHGCSDRPRVSQHRVWRTLGPPPQLF